MMTVEFLRVKSLCSLKTLALWHELYSRSETQSCKLGRGLSLAFCTCVPICLEYLPVFCLTTHLSSFMSPYKGHLFSSVDWLSPSLIDVLLTCEHISTKASISLAYNLHTNVDGEFLGIRVLMLSQLQSQNGSIVGAKYLQRYRDLDIHLLNKWLHDLTNLVMVTKIFTFLTTIQGVKNSLKRSTGIMSS